MTRYAQRMHVCVGFQLSSLGLRAHHAAGQRGRESASDITQGELAHLGAHDNARGPPRSISAKPMLLSFLFHQGAHPSKPVCFSRSEACSSKRARQTPNKNFKTPPPQAAPPPHGSNPPCGYLAANDDSCKQHQMMLNYRESHIFACSLMRDECN